MKYLAFIVLTASLAVVNAKEPCHTKKCSKSICEDYVNSCGQSYGGCYCAHGPTPTFTDPGCPSSSSSSTCTESICVDKINSCGIWYGGCYAVCSGYPTPSFTVPPCPSSSSSTIAPSTTSSCPYICKDYFDDCENTYGPGCFSSCSGQKDPSYTIPSCSATVTA